MNHLLRKLTASRFSAFETLCFCAIALLIDSVFYAGLSVLSVMMINHLTKGVCDDK